MFKIFPVTFTSDGRKVPIKELQDWRAEATTDQNKIAEWQRLYGHKIKAWGIPTGPTNNILALDVDVKDTNGFNTLQKYPLHQTMSQTTKSGGRHFIFQYPNDGRTYGNRVRFDDGLDIRGEGGFIAWYGNADNLPIAPAPSWLSEASVKREKIEFNEEDLVSVTPEIVNATLEEACDNIRNAPEGESNNVLNVEAYRIGQLLPSKSINYDVAFQALFSAAKERGKPDYEAKATIESGFKGGAQSPTICPFGNKPPELMFERPTDVVIERWTPPFFTTYDLKNISKLKKPVIFKDWSTEDIAITTADGGTGKTTLKLNEAICLALGEPFLGFDNKRGEGRTLFIAGEDPREKLGAMIGAILKQRGILDDKEKVRKVLNNIVIKNDAEMCLITKGKDGFIRINREAMDKILQAVEDIKPDMIVFDPIASFWGSESLLNDMSIAVAKFMGELVQKSNACVEAINHMGKSSSTSKDMSQFAGRGGTGLPSHARVSRVLRPVFDEEYFDMTGKEIEDDKSYILCNINKFTDGSDFYNKPFMIERDGYLFNRVVLEERVVKEEQDKMSDQERVFTFIRTERQGGRYPTKKIVVAHFSAQSEKLSKERVDRAIEYCMYYGHLGERVKVIDNPDVVVGGKVLTVEDSDGDEI